ncbi:MAG: alkaline phosphatase family protein [Verrucomicrobiota bacterium]
MPSSMSAMRAMVGRIDERTRAFFVPKIFFATDANMVMGSPLPAMGDEKRLTLLRETVTRKAPTLRYIRLMNRWDGVLAILADGARPDIMAELAAAGEMPVLKQHFVDRGGFRTATGVFPTVSGPAHLPLLTGMHPGQANLPGIRWAERPTGGRGSFLFRTRSYMALGRAFKLKRDIPPGVTTLFHHLPSIADINTWFVRGCPASARLTRFSKAAAFLRSLITTDWYASDLQAERAVKRAWDRGFRSAFAVFPAIDELGHRFGPTAEQSREAYRRFDRALGRVIDDLHRRGRLERTLIVITSDHGQTDTHTHLDIDDLVRAVYPRTLAYPKLWRHLFSAQAAAMVSGNAMANLYLEGEGGWAERPDFDAPGSRACALRDQLIDHAGIEHVIYRRGASAFVVAARNGRTVVTVDGSGPIRVNLTSEGGGDALGYDGVPTTMIKDEVAARTAATMFPDAPAQLIDFFAASRAGDMVVCARPGYDLRSRYEYQPHRGSHGGLHRDHLLVPAAVNARWPDAQGPGNGAVQAGGGVVRAIDLFPTILTALGAPAATGRGGRAIPLVRVT